MCTYEIHTYSDVYCILVEFQIHETCIKQAISIKIQGEIYKCPREMENGKAKGNGKVNPMRKGPLTLMFIKIPLDCFVLKI